MVCKHILPRTFLNESDLICLHTVKWFQVLICNTYNPISYYSFVCTQLNGFKYWYLTLIILFHITHLFAHSEMLTSTAF